VQEPQLNKPVVAPPAPPRATGLRRFLPTAIAIILAATLLVAALLGWRLHEAASGITQSATATVEEEGLSEGQRQWAEAVIGQTITQERSELFGALLVAMLIMLGAGLLVAWLAHRRLTTSLQALARGARHGQTQSPQETSDDSSPRPKARLDLNNELGAMQVTYEFLEQVLDRIQDGVIVCDAQGCIIDANEAAARLLRRSVEELAGEDLHSLAEPTVFESDGSLLAEGSTRLRTPTGDAPAVAYTACALVEPSGAQRWVIVFRNLTDEHRTQKRIRYLARYDTLTRVPNRMEFQHRLQQAIARSRRDGTRAALLYIDLDDFKDINDRLGHPIGDRALEIAARRIMDSMESGTLVGRLGGDEFAVLIEGLPGSGDVRLGVAATIRGMLDKLAREFHVEGHEVVLTASIGAALLPDNADNVIDLIRNADAAMYHAKQNGGNTYGFYSAEMNADAVDRLVLKSELRSAIARDEFQLVYQPKIDLRDGRISGCEALLRWRHSRRGDVPPTVFIALAEENTLIYEVGEWVLDHVCTDFSTWQQRVPWPGRVAVNLSLRQLRQRDFVDRVEAIFSRHQLAPSCVELEITESTLADHGEKTLRMLDRLYELGLHLSIDDFGTGYSSLSSLQHFPIGTLKIDQGFIREAGEQRNSAAIVGAIVGLGRSLGMDVVAEGVETAEQLAFLRRIGCTFGQGHLFGEPVSSEEYLALLEAQQQGRPVHSELLQQA
jgi:diguanylate cyclase (GGDEF)-like protein